MKNRYFNALHYSDAQIGRLIVTLKEMGIYDQTTIVIMGDHGESFYEHNTPVHSNELFNETILTEVVIKLPQGKSFMKPM